MIIERRFEWGESDVGQGFIPEGIEGADPTGGFGAAHDLLEHFPAEFGIPGGFAGEMAAFGAMFHVRNARFHDWSPDGIYESQHRDLESFFANLMYGQDLLPAPGWALAKIERYEGDYDFDTSEARYWIREAVFECCRIDAGYRDGKYSLRKLIDARRKLPRDLVIDVLGWMVVGYEAALKRYEGVAPFSVVDLFRSAEEAFEEKSPFSGEVGDYIILRVDTEALRATAVRGNCWEDESEVETEEEFA